MHSSNDFNPSAQNAETLFNQLCTYAKAVRETYSNANDGPAFFALHPLLRGGLRPLLFPATVMEDTIDLGNGEIIPLGHKIIQMTGEQKDYERAENALNEIGYPSDKTKGLIVTLVKIHQEEKQATQNVQEVEKGVSHIQIKDALDKSDLENILNAVQFFKNYCNDPKNDLPPQFGKDIEAIYNFAQHALKPQNNPKPAPTQENKRG